MNGHTEWDGVVYLLAPISGNLAEIGKGIFTC